MRSCAAIALGTPCATQGSKSLQGVHHRIPKLSDSPMSNSNLTGASICAQTLASLGIDRVFGLPGEQTSALLDEIATHGIEFVLARHEQGAVFMANTEAMVSESVGVCLSTVGPGATNLVTGIAEAALDRIPLVALVAQTNMSTRERVSHQELDLPQLFESLTTTLQARTSEDCSALIVQAFEEASRERRPVVVLLPEDVMRASANPVAEPTSVPAVVPSRPNREGIELVVERIRSSARPVALVGREAARGDAAKSVRKFIQKAGLATLSTFEGKGVVPDSSDLSLFTVYGDDRDLGASILLEADLILLIGFDPVELSPESVIKDDASVIHVGDRSLGIRGTFAPSVELIADVGASVDALARRVARHTASTAWRREWRRRVVTDRRSWNHASTVHGLTVPTILPELSRRVLESGRVVCDVGAHKLWCARNLDVERSGAVIIRNSLASMGVALPGVIGAAYADPNALNIALCGDGGFLMNVQELETATRSGLDLAVIVCRDDALGLIGLKDERDEVDPIGVELHNPDITALCRAFGASARSVSSLNDLRRALDDHATEGGVLVIDVPVNAAVNDELETELTNGLAVVEWRELRTPARPIDIARASQHVPLASRVS